MKFLPGEYAISFIHRPTYYSECGFVGYNLRHPDTRLFVSKLDINDTSNCKKFTQDVFKKFKRIDVLINSAGLPHGG